VWAVICCVGGDMLCGRLNFVCVVRAVICSVGGDMLCGS